MSHFNHSKIACPSVPGGLAAWLAANAIRVDLVVGCKGAVLYKSDRVSDLAIAADVTVVPKGAPDDRC